MIENINSGADYAQIVINSILETEKSIPQPQQMPINMLTFLTEEVNTRADKYYHEYITGNRETFLFNDVDMIEMFDKAGERYLDEILYGMVDKDLLEVSVDETGEFLYGLSEKGKQITEDIFGINKSDEKE